MKNVDKELIEKFFSDQCNAEEEKLVKAWLSSMKADFQDLSALEKSWYQFEPPEDDINFWDKEELYKKLQLLIDTAEHTNDKPVRKIYPETPTIPEIPIHTSNRKQVFSNYAAIILVLLISIAALYYFTEYNVERETPLAEEILTKSNPRGIKSTITLSDGTIVRLNSESKITFPKRFVKDQRIVTLEGEAFFEVKSDTSRPFIVKAGKLEAKVLGTSFNVNTLNEYNKVDIALLTGKLAVYSTTNKKDKQVLLPSERATYDSMSDQIKTDHFNKEQVLSWKDGILIFKEAKIEEIIIRLERWYACEITITDKANRSDYNKVKFTGKFDNKSLEEVLKGLSLASGLKYELKNKKVYFY